MINLKTNNWEIKDIDTILFDKDGTIIDLHYFWGKMTEMRVNKVIEVFNLETSLFKELNLCLGYDSDAIKMLSDGITALYSRVKIIEIFKNDLLKYGVKTNEQVLTRIFDEVSSEFYKNINEYTKPIDETIDFVKRIRKFGIKTGIVTADSVESSKLSIKNFAWENLFDVVIGRESTKGTKESGEAVCLALSQLHSESSNTIMVGDAPTDYIAAKNGGVNTTILLSTGQVSIDELQKTSKYTAISLKDVTIY